MMLFNNKNYETDQMQPNFSIFHLKILRISIIFTWGSLHDSILHDLPVRFDLSLLFQLGWLGICIQCYKLYKI